MSIKPILGVAGASIAEHVAERGSAWPENGPRPRVDALLTLDPTQRPSAPPRWAA